MEQEGYDPMDEGEPEVTIPATEDEYLISHDCQILNDTMDSRTMPVFLLKRAKAIK